MPELEKPGSAQPSVWGIIISARETDIDISVSERAWHILRIGSWFFGILFVLTIALSLFLCFSSGGNDSFFGVLKAVHGTDIRLPASDSGSMKIDEILVSEGSLVASGQTLIRFTAEDGSSSSLNAPLTGVVEQVPLQVSQQVPPGSLACRLSDIQTLTFQGKVSETSLEGISPGKACRLQMNAFPDRSFPGVVEGVGAKGEFDPSLGYSLFPIWIRVTNPDQVLRIGMSGTGSVN